VTESPSGDVARKWWNAIDRADFDAAISLMSPTAIVDWPLSNERMTTPDAWKTVNERYPGRWAARIRSLVDDGSTVVTVTDVTDGGITVKAISFFTISEGRIANLIEYWPETYAAPGWRSELVEPIVPETSEVPV